jgi:hypothetical protein
LHNFSCGTWVASIPGDGESCSPPEALWTYPRGGDRLMKRWGVIGLVVVMLVTLMSVSFAGDRQRGRWEGFAIGLGAVTLYNLFGHGQFSPVIPPHRVVEKRVYHHPPWISGPSGHWEIHRQWVPENRVRVWVPGHHENGYWVKGHYEVRIYPGHYVRRKIWVKQRPYRYHSRFEKLPPPWARAHGRTTRD